jgi:hypothetical protein
VSGPDPDFWQDTNLNGKCFHKATGAWPSTVTSDAYMTWCEEQVGEWRKRGELLGYVWPFFVTGNVATGTQTYHEWLTERVGL